MYPLRITRKKRDLQEVETDIEKISFVFNTEIKVCQLYLFGSASEKTMTDQSDFDLLVTCATPSELKSAQRKFSSSRKILPHCAFDVVWMLESEYQRKKEIGGVCYIVANEGRKLI